MDLSPAINVPGVLGALAPDASAAEIDLMVNSLVVPWVIYTDGSVRRPDYAGAAWCRSRDGNTLEGQYRVLQRTDDVEATELEAVALALEWLEGEARAGRDVPKYVHLKSDCLNGVRRFRNNIGRDMPNGMPHRALLAIIYGRMGRLLCDHGIFALLSWERRNVTLEAQMADSWAGFASAMCGEPRSRNKTYPLQTCTKVEARGRVRPPRLWYE